MGWDEGVEVQETAGQLITCIPGRCRVVSMLPLASNWGRTRATVQSVLVTFVPKVKVFLSMGSHAMPVLLTQADTRTGGRAGRHAFLGNPNRTGNPGSYCYPVKVVSGM